MQLNFLDPAVIANPSPTTTSCIGTGPSSVTT